MECIRGKAERPYGETYTIQDALIYQNTQAIDRQNSTKPTKEG